MLISLCIPCMGRTYDLKKTMPYTIATANASPPVEISILSYNSKDDLDDYIGELKKDNKLLKGNKLSYTKYTGSDHYHMAHAYNLAVLASKGDYVVVLGTDAFLFEDYVKTVRKMAEEGCIWMRDSISLGIVACQRKEFMDAGGYDEQFEFYGGEDKDLDGRLKRRGKKFGLLPKGLIRVMKTDDKIKLVNFRSSMSKTEMMTHNSKIRAENAAKGVLVANKDGWGKWD